MGKVHRAGEEPTLAIAAAVVEPVPRTVRLHFGDWRNAAIAGVELGEAVLRRQKKLAVVHHGEAANTAQHSMGAMISRTWDRADVVVDLLYRSTTDGRPRHPKMVFADQVGARPRDFHFLRHGEFSPQKAVAYARKMLHVNL